MLLKKKVIFRNVRTLTQNHAYLKKMNSFLLCFFPFETVLLSRSIKTTEGEKSKILREMRTRRKQLVKLGIIYPIVSSFPLEKSFVVVVTVVVSVVIPPVPPSVPPIVELEDFLTNFLTFFTLVDPVSDMVLMP